MSSLVLHVPACAAAEFDAPVRTRQLCRGGELEGRDVERDEAIALSTHRYFLPLDALAPVEPVTVFTFASRCRVICKLFFAI